MGTDLQEAKLMKQEADILRTCYYQDWVWHEYWTFQTLFLNSYFGLCFRETVRGITAIFATLIFLF